MKLRSIEILFKEATRSFHSETEALMSYNQFLEMIGLMAMKYSAEKQVRLSPESGPLNQLLFFLFQLQAPITVSHLLQILLDFF
jgi:hypothetical protein